MQNIHKIYKKYKKSLHIEVMSVIIPYSDILYLVIYNRRFIWLRSV